MDQIGCYISTDIRGVISKEAIHRLKKLVNINKVDFVSVFEPFVDKNKIEGYKRFLGFQYSISNENGKTLCFWSINLLATTIINEYHQITITFEDGVGGDKAYISAIYTKCIST